MVEPLLGEPLHVHAPHRAALDAPAALVVAHIAGAGLLSLGCACWLARNDGPNRVLGLVAAILVYHSVAVAVLANAGAGARLVGVLTWPAVALHAALAVWCVLCLRGGWRTLASRHTW